MKKILLIQLKQIGDVLITTSLLKNIKSNFPDSKVDIVVYDYCAGVVENNPYIDKIITIDSRERKSILKLYFKIKKLRLEKYDYSIDLLADVKSALIGLCAGAREKIVSKKDKLRNKLFYTKRVENNKKNVCEYRNYLLTAISEDLKFENEVKIYLKDDEIILLKSRMIENGIDFSKPVAAFGINSRREYKIWNIDYFVEMIDYISEKYNFQIVLYNNSSERDYAIKAKDKIKNKNVVFTDIRTDNIRELAALLKNCDIFIGNEGGPRHISESVGVPTFTVAYTTHVEEDWVINSKLWGTVNQMVQIDDYLNMGKDEFEQYRNNIGRNRELEIEEFKKLKPEFVIKKLEEMINYLINEKLFRDDIKWKK